MSTAYYALFHGLAECCADELFNRNMRGQPGWVRIYRAVNHRLAQETCRSQETRSLPIEIRDFASLFVDLQDKRHRADYDPLAVFYKSEVERLILDSRAVLREFEQADAPATEVLRGPRPVPPPELIQVEPDREHVLAVRIAA